MTADIDLAEAIANRLAAVGDAQGCPSARMVLTDFVGNMTMQRAMLSQPCSGVYADER